MRPLSDSVHSPWGLSGCFLSSSSDRTQPFADWPQLSGQCWPTLTPRRCAYDDALPRAEFVNLKVSVSKIEVTYRLATEASQPSSAKESQLFSYLGSQTCTDESSNAYIWQRNTKSLKLTQYLSPFGESIESQRSMWPNKISKLHGTSPHHSPLRMRNTVCKARAWEYTNSVWVYPSMKNSHSTTTWKYLPRGLCRMGNIQLVVSFTVKERCLKWLFRALRKSCSTSLPSTSSKAF